MRRTADTLNAIPRCHTTRRAQRRATSALRSNPTLRLLRLTEPDRSTQADLAALTHAYPLDCGEAAKLLRAAGGQRAIAVAAYEKALVTVRVTTVATVLLQARLVTAIEIARQTAEARLLVEVQHENSVL